MLGWLHTCRLVPVAIFKQMLLSTGQMQHSIQTIALVLIHSHFFFWFFGGVMQIWNLEVGLLAIAFRKELTSDARELKGELYCLPCHDKMGVPICGACRRPIEGRVVNAMGKQWHVEVRCSKTPNSEVTSVLKSKTIFAGAFSEEMWLPSFISFLHSHC